MALFVAGIFASVVVFASARASVEHSEQLMLHQQAAQGSLVLSPYLAQSQPQITALESMVGAGGLDVSAWDSAAAAAAKAGDTAVGLVRSSAGHLQLVASFGPVHMRFGTSADVPLVSALARRSTPFDMAVSSGHRRWIVQLVGGAGLPSGYGLYTSPRPSPTRCRSRSCPAIRSPTSRGRST